MDFAIMGTLNSYVKTKNLQFAAKYKIRTGQTITNSNGNFISFNTSTFDKLREASTASTDQAKQQRISLIRKKLRDGQKLSEEELGFLRANAPSTYKKAKAVDDAREELKSDLKKAKTKEEAREAMTRAMVKASTTAMAELSALDKGGGNVAGGCFGSTDTSQGGAMISGGDVSTAGNMNVSGGDVLASGGAMNLGGEVSAEGNLNVSGMENQTLADVNQSIQTAGDKATESINDDDNKNPSAQITFDNPDKLTPEGIMEKYLWTIRALEDEWAHFTNSKDYKDLPDHRTDKTKDKKVHRQIDAPNRIFFNAAVAYRKSMNCLTA